MKKRKVIERFMTLTEKLANNTNKSNCFGTDVEIFRTEIHVINLIGDNQNLHLSELARKFSVTRGAISATIKRLVKKGLVKKVLDNENQTRLLVSLTEKGIIAYNSHEKYHNEYDSDMFTYINELNEDELEILNTFLIKANKMADRHL